MLKGDNYGKSLVLVHPYKIEAWRNAGTEKRRVEAAAIWAKVDAQRAQRRADREERQSNPTPWTRFADVLEDLLDPRHSSYD